MMRIGTILLGVTLVLSAAACGGSGTETTVRTTEPGGSGETANTGIAELDQVLNAALSIDRIELAGLTGYQRIACVEESEGAGGPPVCRDGEDAGAEVEAYPVLQCELAWVRPEVVPDTYAQALGGEPSLVAVYRPVQRPLTLEADYVAAFDTNGDENAQAGVALSIRDGRVIQVEYDCNNFAGLYAADKVEEFVVAPEDAGETTDEEAEPEGEQPAE